MGVGLLHLNLSTGLFKSLLQCFSLFLGNAFLQRAGSAVNEILGFLQAQAVSRPLQPAVWQHLRS